MKYISGEDIKRIRKSSGLTTAQISALANVKTRKTISNWENGVGEPSINQFLQICRGCGFDYYQIIVQVLNRSNINEELILKS